GNGDSDVNAQGRSALLTLAAGTATVDAGLRGVIPAFGFGVNIGAGGDDTGRAVTTDAVGNVYVTGQFTDSIDLDPGPGGVTLTSTGPTSTYVAKFSAAGALLWGRALTGTGSVTSGGLAVDGNGNVHVTGSFTGTAFGLTSTGTEDVFVVKLDQAG